MKNQLTNLRHVCQEVLLCIMVISFHACTCKQKSNDIAYNVDCRLDKTFIRLDKNQMVVPQHLFFSCNIKNNTADTLNWYYLGFNKGYFGELSADYISKAFIRLKTGDSLQLYQESYESQEFIGIMPYDSLHIILSLDEFCNDSAYIFKNRFDSIASLIEDLVYYTKDTCFLFRKFTNYRYFSIETETFEEADGTKTTIPVNILNECLRNGGFNF